MSQLARVYDDPNFRPTVAQTVCIHMVFAIMFFQYAVRNYEDQVQQSNLNDRSNSHYHYSLGMYYQLVCSHTVQDVQALTLICAHLRNFPKPGASWILTMVTMSLAIELGMHRSVKRWASELAPNPLEVELRKRTFWSILTIHVTLSGKLGRPMILRVEDFDVELPEPIDDDLISEAGIDTTRTGKCAHSIGLAGWKLGVLFMELYSTIYAVQRSPETYIQTVNGLEAKLRVWTEGLPSELLKGESGSSQEEGRVFALYLQAWVLEFKMLLRHPAVSLTLDPNFNAESMKICVESARQMLDVVKQIQGFKSLDTTWYQTAVYVMAINTTLFAAWEKRKEITAQELAALRAEMESWLEVMGEIGLLLGELLDIVCLATYLLMRLGSGTRLREAVRVVTDGTLGLLSRSLQSNSGYINQGSSGQDIKPPHRRSNSSGTNGFSGYGQSFGDANGGGNGNGNGTAYTHTDNQLAHTQTPYPAATQYSSYPDPTVNTTLSYTSQENHAYPNFSGNSSDPVEAPLLAAFAAQASQVAPNWTRPAPSQSHNPVVNSSSQSWQQWTSTMTGNLEPQDRYSASALMQLGGRDLGVPDVAGSSSSITDLGTQTSMAQDASTNMSSASPGIAWPLNIFDIGHGSSGS
jgi:Fungal specific transcription factor domain